MAVAIHHFETNPYLSISDCDSNGAHGCKVIFRASFCRFILDSNLVGASAGVLLWTSVVLQTGYQQQSSEVSIEAEDTERPTYHKSAELSTVPQNSWCRLKSYLQFSGKNSLTIDNIQYKVRLFDNISKFGSGGQALSFRMLSVSRHGPLAGSSCSAWKWLFQPVLIATQGLHVLQTSIIALHSSSS